jgi:nitrous oxidase accessory protein
MTLKRKCLTVGIILLFVGTFLISSTAQNTGKPLPTSRGDWLYVGGSGPGNYTTINSAINNSSDGDTIFVYDDSSPYYENVVVNKSIALLGEGKTSTVVDGRGNGDVISISADNVRLDGFTIQHSGTITDSGVEVVAANGVIISNNTVTENIEGISLSNSNNSRIERTTISHNQDVSTYIFLCHNTVVADNLITSNAGGIDLLGSTYTNISQNVIEHNVIGIDLAPSSDNTTIYHNIIRLNGAGISMAGANNSIVGNSIRSNDFGIEVTTWTRSMTVRYNVIDGNSPGLYFWGVHSNSTIITSNTFSNNLDGIDLFDSSLITISSNNFINNGLDAYFRLKLFEKNFWSRNYWDDHHGIGPKVIRGKVLLFTIDFPAWYIYLEFRIPWVNCDWHPAQKPYDIPGTR